MSINLNWPLFTDDTLGSVKKVFDSKRFTISGYWTGQPTFNQEFADRFARYNNARFCVPVMNGSMALVMALEALDIGFGDEVIVPALSWVATATAVLQVNAFPVMIDVDPETYCMDPELIEAKITGKTRAIIPVHLYGCMADMDRIKSVADRHNLFVIEDCAQTHGSVWKGKKAGTIGHIGAFSFEQSKVLTSGEGGCVVTDDKALYEKLLQLSVDSRVFSGNELKYGDLSLVEKGEIQGTNFKLPEIEAAILIEQLNHLEEQNRIRQENALYLDERFSLVPGVKIMKRHGQVDFQSFFSYCLRVDSDHFGCDSSNNLLLIREKILKSLRRDLGISPYFLHSSYPPISKSRMFCPWTKKRFPETIARDSRYWRELSLPNAEKASRESLVFHHALLLQPREILDTLVGAVSEALAVIRAGRK
jgi:L-glutamine:2-deoxy-scyllo-inosose/3-amino-2,3-dideoxy-scyllo-inosose aminotransferase